MNFEGHQNSNKLKLTLLKFSSHPNLPSWLSNTTEQLSECGAAGKTRYGLKKNKNGMWMPSNMVKLEQTR